MEPWFALCMVLLAAPTLSEVDESERRARALAAGGHHAEAAEELERLVAAGGTRHALVAAGHLRADAGHHAHAYRHFTRYLELQDLAPSSRAAALEQRELLAASTRAVAVDLGTPITAKISARRLTDPPLPELEFTAIDGRTSLVLDLQAWELRVEAPGYAPQRALVVRSEHASELAITLEPLPPPPAPSPAPTPPRPAAPGPSRAFVAGAVLVPLGLAALGGAVAVIPGYVRSDAAFENIRTAAAGRPPNDAEVAELRALASTARRQEALMTGLGVTAGVLGTVGAVLLARGLRERRHRLRVDAGPGAFHIGLSGRF